MLDDDHERHGDGTSAATGGDDGDTDWDRALALGQGAFYVATGVWPIVSLRTFEAVTGPKADGWLVKTAGVLITAIGAGLTTAGLRGRVTPDMKLIAVGAAAGLTAMDVVYVRRGRIAPVYLLDALAEVGLIGAWAAARVLGREQGGRA